MTLRVLTPADARDLLARHGQLIDIREPDEHRREHIPGAMNVPLSRLDALPACDGPIVFHCRSGARTDANAHRLAAAAGANCYLLDGGVEGWRAAGFETRRDRTQPIEIMRQVQLVAGALILLGLAASLLIAPGFAFLSAFVGAGLMFAGATGWCGMARLLALMPWNRRAARPS